MAHKKGSGSSNNGRESAGRRLGLKRSDGQQVNGGEIILRQRGTKMFPGLNVKIGRDHTLFALIKGIVAIKKRGGKLYVNVIDIL